MPRKVAIRCRTWSARSMPGDGESRQRDDVAAPIRRLTATSITSSEAPTCAQIGIGMARRLSMMPAETMLMVTWVTALVLW